MRGRVVVLLAALLAAGCAAAQQDDQGGMGLPQQLEGESYPGPRAEIPGTMHVADDGCFHVRLSGAQYLTVWPAGSTHDGDGLLLPDGSRVEDGTPLVGTGTVMPVAQLAGGPDGYWAQVVGFCAPDASDVLVLDQVDLSVR